MFFRGITSLLPPIYKREGVTDMNVTWSELFQFGTFVVAVINLILLVNKKK